MLNEFSLVNMNFNAQISATNTNYWPLNYNMYENIELMLLRYI